MPRRLLKRVPSHPEKFKSPWLHKLFGNSLLAHDLWHINKRSVAMAFFVGLFCGFLPIPVQMPLAAAMAIKARSHLPLSVTLVWVSNPITMPAIFYGNYVLGAVLLNLEVLAPSNGLTFEIIKEQLPILWLPLLVGSLTAALLAGSIGYITIRAAWRFSVIRRWKNRRRTSGK